MSISPVIPKGRPDHPGLDYEALRAEGISHLENLATEIWTDFNVHDPGITLLELLSYAITDLGYRTRKLPIADLLAAGGDQVFFEAVEILPCAPVTARDYRKLLIDLHGVKNAWVEKYTGPVLFTHKGEDYGLFAEDAFRFRDIAYQDGTGWKPDEDKVRKILHSFFGPDVEELTFENALRKAVEWITEGVPKTECAPLVLEAGAFPDTCRSRERCPVPVIGPAAKDDDFCKLLCELLCRYGFTPLKVNVLDDSNRESESLLRLNGLMKITLDLDDKIDPENESQTRPIVDRVMKRLQANRFLGHDYVEPPVIVGKLPVAVCLHIEVAAGKDILDVAAEAIWRIEQHLTPTLRFHTFKEMKAKGYAVEDIYNGPLLDHGFLDDPEVDRAQLREVIRHSDLTNAATVHPDVLTVHELKLKVFPETEFKVKNQYQIYTPDSTDDPAIQNPTLRSRPLKPQINLCSSCVFVTQSGRRCEINEAALEEILCRKRMLAECQDMPGGLQKPVGTFRSDLSEYRALQFDLPGVYGVGDSDVTADTPAAKKCARKQLLAYLAFFDQILAAYLLQLGQLRRLLSVDQDPSLPTYLNADLRNVSGLSDIIDPDKLFPPESPATQQDRRNRLLDHLLARFGEAFSDYSATLATACKGANGKQDFMEFLRSKSDFLRELPDLGYARGRAYNYRGGKHKKVWNTTNVAGIKKRVHLMLGLKGSWQTQSLLLKPAYRLDIAQVRGSQGALQHQIVLKVLPDNLPAGVSLPFGNVVLRSPRYSSPKNAQDKRDKLYSDLWNKNFFTVGPHPRENDRWAVLFSTGGKTELYGDPMDEAEAKDLLEYAQDLVSFEPAGDKEGFHVLEHILLRPNDPDDLTLQIPLGCEPPYTPSDPYSSWLSVMLPAWPARFQEEAFRKHLEQIFRREMPAELAVRFCWLDKEKMRRFEELYMAWMEAKAACTPDECHVTAAANELIKWLNETPCSCSCAHCCADEQACGECKDCDSETIRQLS